MADQATSKSGYEPYYVPESSPLAICATIGLVLSIFGAASIMNDMTFGEPGKETNSWFIFSSGLFFLIATLFVWFRTATIENMKGMNSAQLKQSYVIGMQWFIFSEVMFFFAFFLALFYIRWFAAPWLAGEGDKGINEMLWPGFDYVWPLLSTPQDAIGGIDAQVAAGHIANNGEFVGATKSMAPPGGADLLHWLPMYNTILLISSSVTCHWAHHALLHNDRQKFIRWLAVTVLMGIAFLYLQYMEYVEAYSEEYMLTLGAGAYGTTFFLLTGFHGFHVGLGMIMLLIQLIRAVKYDHFTAGDHFGFAASSWYWHFVDVVWIFLMLVVYIF